MNTFSPYDPTLPWQILQKNNPLLHKTHHPSQLLTYEPLTQIYIPNSGSRIIANNRDTLWVGKIYSLAGLFDKTLRGSPTFVYGRWLCDTVKDKYQCKGFFTSDEIHLYGISHSAKEDIFHKMGKNKGGKEDHDLLVFFAYDEAFSQKLYFFLLCELAKQITEAVNLTYNAPTKNKIGI